MSLLNSSWCFFFVLFLKHDQICSQFKSFAFSGSSAWNIFAPRHIHGWSQRLHLRLLMWHCFKVVFSNHVSIYLTHFPMHCLQSSYLQLKPPFCFTVYYLTHPCDMQESQRPSWSYSLWHTFNKWWINPFPYFDFHCCHSFENVKGLHTVPDCVVTLCQTKPNFILEQCGGL